MSVMRCDLLPSNMTDAKEAQVRALLAAYRRGAVLLGREQWRLFFEAGRFDRNHDKDKTSFAAVIGAANRVQMCRWQVVGQLQGWIGNRANEFRDTVTRSTLEPETKHMLHVINRLGMWFSRREITMKATGEAVPAAVRSLARSIMRQIMRRHRRPNLRRISMRLDHRAACLQEPNEASQGGRVGWWVNLSTMERGRKIAVPLLTYDHHRDRRGKVSNGVLVTGDRNTGKLLFGVVTDVGADCAASRAAYEPEQDVMALDFGLSTLFAGDDGALLGKDWLKALRAYDHRITEIARGMQRRGRKPRESARYRKAVTALRGWIRTEAGRVLNALVAARRPAALVLERLDFRNPALSSRLNRIIQNCGRAVIRAKLADLQDRFGVTSEEVNPAYTSQTCSCCGSTWTSEIARHKASSIACGAATECTPMSMRHGISGDAVRRLSVPCSSRRRRSSLNRCAGSTSEGCSAPDPVGGVPPPTRDRPIPTSVGRSQQRLGCRKQGHDQIWRRFS